MSTRKKKVSKRSVKKTTRKTNTGRRKSAESETTKEEPAVESATVPKLDPKRPERERARAERRALKEGRARPQEQATVTPISEKVAKEMPIEKRQIPESLRWKLAALNSEHNAIVNGIRQKVLTQLKPQIDQACHDAIQNDAKARSSQIDVNACINEIIEVLEPNLPKGYSITKLNPAKDEDGQVEARYNPDGVGKRLPV